MRALLIRAMNWVDRVFDKHLERILLGFCAVMLLLVLVTGCSEEREPLLLPVEPNQPGYEQRPKPIIYVPVADQTELKAVCSGARIKIYCCLKEGPAVRFLVYVEQYEVECKAHELDHIVMGPLHVGERM